MKMFICKTCRDGFDIEISGGIFCPECGGQKWMQCYKLPPKALKYRLQWAKEYDVFPLNEDEKPGDYFDADGNFREGKTEVKLSV